MFRLSQLSVIKTFVFALSALMAACGGSPEGAALSSDSLPVSCLERPEAGSCRAAKPAFYYDYATDSCRQLLWGGCGGTVPFDSMEDCVSVCGGRPQR